MGKLANTLLLAALLVSPPALAKDILTQMLDALGPQPAPKHRPANAIPVPIPPVAPTIAAPSVSPVVPLPRPRPEDLGEKPAGDIAPDTSEPAADVNPANVAEPAAATAPADAAKPASTPEPSTAMDAPQSKPDERVYQTGCPALTLGQVEGRIVPPIHDGQCGAQSPLALTGVLVNGRMVKLSGEITTDCAIATMLPAWLSQVDGYAFAKDNTRLQSVTIGTSYMCRNRVGGASTDKLSEHGMADALDLNGFTLEDGRSIDVTTGWAGGEPNGQSIIHQAHDQACSLFMTTLGPDANAEHHDHIHVDFGCHGQSCTARLCE